MRDSAHRLLVFVVYCLLPCQTRANTHSLSLTQNAGACARLSMTNIDWRHTADCQTRAAISLHTQLQSLLGVNSAETQVD